MRSFLVVWMALALVACASAENEGTATKPTKELAAGGAKLRGGGIRMDVQLGRVQPKRPVKNATTVVKPNATVTP